MTEKFKKTYILHHKENETLDAMYVKVPENHIVIDFDIKDKDRNKSFDLNAQVSKSGQGIHLHYIYTDAALYAFNRKSMGKA